jgi:hypothetical protein
MSDQKKEWMPAKPADEESPPAAPGKRRLSRIVHDERGNARVEWIDVPETAAAAPDEHRVPLSVEGAVAKPPKPPEPENAWNPYGQTGAAQKPGGGAKGQRDLRKLSEWIKLKRKMEKDKPPE